MRRRLHRRRETASKRIFKEISKAVAEKIQQEDLDLVPYEEHDEKKAHGSENIAS